MRIVFRTGVLLLPLFMGFCAHSELKSPCAAAAQDGMIVPCHAPEKINVAYAANNLAKDQS